LLEGVVGKPVRVQIPPSAPLLTSQSAPSTPLHLRVLLFVALCAVNGDAASAMDFPRECRPVHLVRSLAILPLMPSLVKYIAYSCQARKIGNIKGQRNVFPHRGEDNGSSTDLLAHVSSGQGRPENPLFYIRSIPVDPP